MEKKYVVFPRLRRGKAEKNSPGHFQKGQEPFMGEKIVIKCAVSPARE